MTINLQAEYQYYLDHKSEFLEKYAGRYVVIKHKQVIGVYSSDIEAIEETTKTHELGTFLIQPVTNEDGEFRFHSRVAI